MDLTDKFGVPLATVHLSKRDNFLSRLTFQVERKGVAAQVQRGRGEVLVRIDHTPVEPGQEFDVVIT